MLFVCLGELCCRSFSCFEVVLSHFHFKAIVHLKAVFVSEHENKK